jgi:hypothetical protein
MIMGETVEAIIQELDNLCILQCSLKYIFLVVTNAYQLKSMTMGIYTARKYKEMQRLVESATITSLRCF